MTTNRIIMYILGALLLIFLPIIYQIVYPLLPSYGSFKTGYDIIVIFPYFFLALGLLASVKIRDSRAFWNTMLFLLTYIILINFSYFQFGTLQLSDMAQSLAVFIPILILLISMGSSKAYSVKVIARQFLIIISVLALSFILPVYFRPFFDIVFSSHIFINHPQWQLPDYIWFLLIIMYALLYMRTDNNTRPLLITITALVFLLFQCFNLAALINAPTHEFKLYVSLIYSAMGFFPLYYMFFSYNRKELFDKLTGLPNEKYLRKVFKKFSDEVSLAIAEIDQFDGFAEKYGNEEKSNLLRFLASHLNTESDVNVYRLDDSNFALVYDGPGSDEVLWQLNSIREKLSHKKFIIRKSKKDRQRSGKNDRGKLDIQPNDINVTISVGIARKNNKINNYDLLVKEALYALKTAKSKGGNRCLRAEDITF